MRFLILMCLTMSLCAVETDPNVTMKLVLGTQNTYVLTDTVSGQRWVIMQCGNIIIPLTTLTKVETPKAPVTQPPVLELDTSKMKVETAETFVFSENRQFQLNNLAKGGWKVMAETYQSGFPKYAIMRVVPK